MTSHDASVDLPARRRLRASGSGGANAAIRNVRRVQRGGGRNPARARRAGRPSSDPSRRAYRIYTSVGVGRALHGPQPSPRPPSRGPASVLAAASSVHPALHRLRRRRITPPLFRFAAFRAASRAMDGPRIGVRGDERGAGVTKGTMARPIRPTGAPDTSRSEMCASGSPPGGGEKKPNGLNTSRGMPIRFRQLRQSGSPRPGKKIDNRATSCPNRPQHMTLAHCKHDIA